VQVSRNCVDVVVTLLKTESFASY